MESEVKNTTVDLLCMNDRHNMIHKFWNTKYREILITKCCEIIAQCSDQKFYTCNTFYCQKVEETCKALINRVNGKQEEVDDDRGMHWPNNIDWFCMDDTVHSFIELLLKKAGKHAPRNSLLDWLYSFIITESPCSTHCIGECHRQGITTCF